MPIYEFECKKCNRVIEKLFNSYNKMIEWLNSPTDSNCSSVPEIFTKIKSNNNEKDCISGKFELIFSIPGKPIIK